MMLPPHTTIALPVQTAVWFTRGCGAFDVEIGAHESVAGS
jgi:hypothetical protein